jgi:hypothetical protein
MSTRIATLLAAPFVVLAFGLRLSQTLWLQPLTWQIHPFVLGLLTDVGSVVASVAVPIGGYLLLTRSTRSRPRTWQLDPGDRSFTAMASPYGTGPGVIIGGWICGGVILTERVPNQEHMRIAQLGIGTTISIVVAALLMTTTLLSLVLGAVLNRTHLSLDADGMTLQRLCRRTRVRWNDRLPGGPPRPRRPNPMVLVLYQQQAAPADGPARPLRLPAQQLHIDTTFLADTIRRYADNPDYRANIGTADELTTLQQTLTTATTGFSESR